MPPYFFSQARLFSWTKRLCMELMAVCSSFRQSEKITLRVLRVGRFVGERGFDLAQGTNLSDPNVAILGRERAGFVELGLQTIGHEVFAVALNLILAVGEILQTGPELCRSQTLRETRRQSDARGNQQDQPQQNRPQQNH